VYWTRRGRATLALCALAGAAAVIPAGPASAHGRTGASWVARTTDRDADGRIDALLLALSRNTRPRQLGAVRVRGYRVRGAAKSTHRHLVVRLVEGPSPDTGARPGVKLGRRGRAHDGARPVLLAAELADTDQDGAVDRVYLRFSEPVSFRGTRRGEGLIAVAGHRVTRILPAVGQHSLTALLVEGPGAGSTPVTLKRGRATCMPVDRAGNRAIPRRVKSGATNSHEVGAGTTGPGAGTGGAGTRTSGGAWHTLTNPIDPRQQTDLPFGYRSHWLQPWRAYLDTPPASQLRDAVGINFNVPAVNADLAAKLLAASGFRRARLEIGWDQMSYDDPTRLRDPGTVRARLSALKASGIRPLILLNANHDAPGPLRFFDARITEPAAAGARQLQVDQPTAQTLIPGLSGFNGPSGVAAEFIATSVSSSGQVELSKPLPFSIQPGLYRAAVLHYAPFTPPLTASGSPHPGFERTLSGWLAYVRAVTREARDVLGGDDFDVEVWNELTFGANFLFVGRYYNPVPAPLAGQGEVTRALLERTVSWLRDPANGVAGVGIGDGFASQTPFAAGSTSPPGLTAIDRHPYHADVKLFPENQLFNGVRPVDALGHPEGTQDFLGRWIDSLIPQYRSFFPEYYLTGIQTEHMVRDLSPITTTIYGVPHGRNTKPAGADQPPAVWVTETNIVSGEAGDVTAADKRHLQAKATLRSLVSFVNKGVSALYFYAVNDGDFAMVDPNAPDGGETMTAVHRLVEALRGPSSIAERRSLTLQAIADRDDHRQFDGDGTAGHPPLYNRDVVAVLPFQVDSNRFVVPAYVMTRDMARLYKPTAPASDVARYDLPPETYRLTLGGVRGDRLMARATDPLTGSAVPVTIVSRAPDQAVLEVPLTDSPRLLVLSD
jgi:hypothetical protein